MSRFYTQGAGNVQDEDEYSHPSRHNRMSPLGSRRQNEYQGLDQGYSNREQGYDYREPNFDLRADFDGEGPRWSEMYGVAKQETYRPVYDHDEPTRAAGVGALKSSDSMDTEMVTVPVLGAEWGREELHAQSRRGQSELKNEERGEQMKKWHRGQRGCCGISWLTRRVFVFIVFFFAAALAVTLYFTIPRAVNFRFWDGEGGPFALVGEPIFTRIPANFTFDAELFLLADSSASYVPVQFSNAVATVLDLSTNVVIAKGNLGKYNMGHKKDVPVKFPVTFSYVGVNTTDATWSNMYSACQHQWNGVNRTALTFRLEVKQSIIGMVNKPVSQDNIVGVACPFEAGKDV